MKVQDILDITEAAYAGNLGAMEMFKFQEKATTSQKAKMKKIVSSRDWPAYKKLIRAVLGVELD